MIYRITIFFISVFIFFSCSERGRDERISEIADIVSDSPKEAISKLEAIDYDSLSEADKHFYDLLTIKAKDKAYIIHTSDSLILRTIEYYSKHKNFELYPEAEYYGGRVYSDLGDYPNALRHFQIAIDNLPPNTENVNLRAAVLSQTGRLLTSLNLFEEAIPYIKSSIKVDEQRNDTVNTVYDLQLLGGTYLRANNYVDAEYYFKKALVIGSNLQTYHEAKSQMYLAAIKYKIGQLDSALYLIRNTPDNVKPKIRNAALGYASNIYLKAGICDTAYLYANELIHNNDSSFREIGYQVILSPKLRKYVHQDSLNLYISNYRGILEKFYDTNKIQLAIAQQSLYNYQLHDRDKQKAEHSNTILKNVVIGISFVILFLITGILYYKNRNRKRLLELHIAIDNINKLKQALESCEYKSKEKDICFDTNKFIDRNDKSESTTESLSKRNTEDELRQRLRNELLSLYDEKRTVDVSYIILKSEVYRKLQEFIKNEKMLLDDDILWDELESIVIESSPNFKINLQLLTGGRITLIELHTAILIKCNVLPSQIAILLNRSKGTVVSRRESLCLKVFDKKMGTKVIDGIIRLL